MDDIAPATPRLHPTPQQARDAWVDLHGTWSFAYDDSAVGIIERWYEREEVFDREICVPFPPEAPASGIGDAGYHPVMWYRRTFHVDPGESETLRILHFGAVDYLAQVWVNGSMVLSHEGGQTPFCADITPWLTDAEEQILVVRAEDPPTDLALPRGKQDWREEPHGIWYHRTSGIWQPVWIESVRSPYITSLQWHPDLDRGVLGISLTTTPHHEAVTVRVELRLHDTVLIDDAFSMLGTELRRDISLDLGSLTMTRDRVLWSPGHPNLIEATITIFVDGMVTDRMESYAGLRSVGVAGGRFLLNGRPFYLRLALEQGFWPDTHLAAPSDEALRREVELTKELGFNGVRVHQKVEDPRYLYWCDRLGLVVWGEMANAYVFNRAGVDRLTREWIEVIERDYSHPCIIVWVPINESWGVPNLLRDGAQRHFVQALYHLTKSLDPTRPCIGNDGWEYLAGDLFGIHDYAFDGDTIRERYGSTEAIHHLLREVQPSHRFVKLDTEQLPTDIPYVLTEFGGISYRPGKGESWFGYGTVDDKEALRDKFAELLTGVLQCAPLAGFCYTQLTDTMQERNGLLTADRRFKLDPAIVRSITCGDARAVPGDIVEDLRKKAVTTFAGSATETAMEEGPTSPM